MADSIGVVTVTRGRPALLRRAMHSVYAQDYPGELHHVVIADDDPDTLAVVHDAPTRRGRRVSGQLVRRSAAEADEQPGDRRFVYPRLCRLTNLGVRACDTDWVCCIDDDNEYEPNHLSSLIACAQATASSAVHSGRQLFWRDGSPYLDEFWHTVANPVESARIYDLMCERGVRVRGTNILMDRTDAIRPGMQIRPSSVMRPEDPVCLIDQNVWLMRREIMLRNPMPVNFTEEDYRINEGIDTKLFRTLLNNGVSLASSGLPTVRYYLGGISNNRIRRPDKRLRSDPGL